MWWKRLPCWDGGLYGRRENPPHFITDKALPEDDVQLKVLYLKKIVAQLE